MRITRTYLLPLLLVTSACRATHAFEVQETTRPGLSVQADGESMTVTNTSDTPMTFAILGSSTYRNSTALWCFGKSGCGEVLAAHSSAQLSYSKISGAASPESEAIVIWWPNTGADFTQFDTVTVRIR